MCIQDLAGDGARALLDHIDPAKCQLVHAKLLCGYLHELLDCPVYLRRAEAPEAPVKMLLV